MNLKLAMSQRKYGWHFFKTILKTLYSQKPPCYSEFDLYSSTILLNNAAKLLIVNFSLLNVVLSGFIPLETSFHSFSLTTICLSELLGVRNVMLDHSLIGLKLIELLLLHLDIQIWLDTHTVFFLLVEFAVRFSYRRFFEVYSMLRLWISVYPSHSFFVIDCLPS